MIHRHSIEAYVANEMSGFNATWRARIWATFKMHGTPMSDRRIVELLEAPDKTNIQPKITNLVQEGLLVEAESAPCHITNRKVRHCKITDKPYHESIPKKKPLPEITDKDIDAIGDALGMHPGGWDLIDPKDIIKETLKHFQGR